MPGPGNPNNIGSDIKKNQILLTAADPEQGIGATFVHSVDAHPKNAVVIGTEFADDVMLGEGNDVFWGLGGDDVANGGAGNDQLRGDEGNDILNGEGGNDVLDGGAGADAMTGGAGNDVYKVDDLGDVVVELEDEGTDTIVWNAGGDLDLASHPHIENAELGENGVNLSGTEGDNELTGNDGGNTISGLGGNDVISGLDGDDVLNGGDGDDVLNGGAGADTLDGGLGADTFVFASADEGGDTINGFSGATGDGDTIDLTALGLLDVSQVGLVGNQLFVEADGIVGITDADALIAAFDSVAGLDLSTDVLI